MQRKHTARTQAAISAAIIMTTMLTATCWTELAVAEERSAKNSIYFEGLGNGILYSINYDRLVIDQLAVRAGLMYLSISASASSSDGSSTSASASMTAIPIAANYVGLYSGSHTLEVGGGAAIVYASGSGSSLGYSSSGSGVGGYLTANVGYRLQPVDGGFNFRVGLMALIGPGLGLDATDDWGVLPWGYISMGYTF